MFSRVPTAFSATQKSELQRSGSKWATVRNNSFDEDNEGGPAYLHLYHDDGHVWLNFRKES